MIRRWLARLFATVDDRLYHFPADDLMAVADAVQCDDCGDADPFNPCLDPGAHRLTGCPECNQAIATARLWNDRLRFDAIVTAEFPQHGRYR